MRLLLRARFVPAFFVHMRALLKCSEVSVEIQILVGTITVHAPNFNASPKLAFNCPIKSGGRQLDIAVFADGAFDKLDSQAHTCKLGLLLEPPAIDPHMYTMFSNPQVYSKFDAVYTFDHKLLEMDGVFRKFMFGGSYVTSTVECRNESMHSDAATRAEKYAGNKSKQTSIMLSNKTRAPGHRLRHEGWSAIRSFPGVVGFGAGVDNYVNDISVALTPFRYSVVIENGFDQGWYFSEKLVSAILSGTVPIYWSSGRYIQDVFDTRGLLLFSDVAQLLQIMQRIERDLDNRIYTSKLRFLRHNAHVAMQFCELHTYRRLIKDLVDTTSCHPKQHSPCHRVKR